MNSINFNSDNLIIMWYPRFAGGKFIMNCLSLSQHCVPMDIETCNHLLNFPDDYNYRLSKVIGTLPPKNDMHLWFNYEFNNAKFYDDPEPSTVNHDWNNHSSHESENLLFARFKKGIIHNGGIDNRISNLIDKNIDFFAETRGNNIEHITRYISLWPNAKIIKLINFEKFQLLAADKKQTGNIQHSTSHYCGNECREKYDSFKGKSWPDWEIFVKNDYNIDKVAKYVKINNEIITEIKQFYPWHIISNPIFNVDVDETYFNKDKFFMQIQKLYDWLGYDDFNETLLLQYYTAYIDLHKT